MARTNEQVADDFNKVIADTEQLLKTVGAAGNERGGAMRESIEKNIKAAKDRVAEMQESAAESARAAARATEEYVADNPWRSMGATFGVGVVAGIVIGLLIERR